MSGLAQPTGDQGREWAEKELTDPRYRDVDVSIFGKISRAVRRLFERLVDTVTGQESPWFIIGVVVFTLLVVGLVIWRVRRGADAGFSRELFDMDSGLAAADPRQFRRRAEAARAAEDWPTACAERIRAVFAELHAKRLIDVEAASTAAELASAGAAAVPQMADDLGRSARLFDRIVFGDYAADEADCEFAENLDEAAQRLRSTAAAGEGQSEEASAEAGLGEQVSS